MEDYFNSLDELCVNSDSSVVNTKIHLTTELH